MSGLCASYITFVASSQSPEYSFYVDRRLHSSVTITPTRPINLNLAIQVVDENCLWIRFKTTPVQEQSPVAGNMLTDQKTITEQAAGATEMKTLELPTAQQSDNVTRKQRSCLCSRFLCCQRWYKVE